MLIIYRTNEGFTGHIVSLDRQQSLVEFEAWRVASQPTPEMAAIAVDESLLRADLLGDLTVNVAAYRVVGGTLTLDGEPVDLGYESSAIGAVERMRADPNMVALFDMDETALRAWMETQAQADINVLVWQALRELARAAKVAVR